MQLMNPLTIWIRARLFRDSRIICVELSGRLFSFGALNFSCDSGHYFFLLLVLTAFSIGGSHPAFFRSLSEASQKSFALPPQSVHETGWP
jgi:hypothetical protein